MTKDAYFEPVPRDETCPYCVGLRIPTALPAPLDAVFCVSLQEQPHRTQAAAEHFHDVGLCRHVLFYRPTRSRHGGAIAIWESHRAMARQALSIGARSALLLEDDVKFVQPWEVLAPRIERALARLPPRWRGFYIGHVPLQAYFVSRDALRVRSGCLHAYIARAPLLEWLAATRPLGAATWPLSGGIDGALAELPDMYALFPMAALQRPFGDNRLNPRFHDDGRPRSWFDKDRWRVYVIFRGAVVVQALAVILSPFHRLTLERFRRRSDSWTQNYNSVRASGLFDEPYYLQLRPDVADSGVDPLGHYFRHGASEGAQPHPLFDGTYYAAQCPDLGKDNPLVHYLRSGAAAGLDPHPLFDSSWYLDRHPELRVQGVNPLVHYLTIGWRAGEAPHPEFDAAAYLRDNSDVAAAGLEPLRHYVTLGQAEGRRVRSVKG